MNTLTEAELEWWREYLVNKLFFGEPENQEELSAIFSSALAQLRAQEPVAYERYVGDKFHSFARTTEGWNEAFCKPLYAAPQPAQGMVMVPREPTDEMFYTFKAEWDRLQRRSIDAFAAAYKALLAAAQKGI